MDDVDTPYVERRSRCEKDGLWGWLISFCFVEVNRHSVGQSQLTRGGLLFDGPRRSLKLGSNQQRPEEEPNIQITPKTHLG